MHIRTDAPVLAITEIASFLLLYMISAFSRDSEHGNIVFLTLRLSITVWASRFLTVDIDDPPADKAANLGIYSDTLSHCV